MKEEEKQVISKLREIIDYDKKHRLETIYDKEQIEFRNNIELMLNLVEKLQKENEELRVQGSIVYLDYKILKDKIREIINEDLPDDEICEVCEKYDVNGVVIKQKLIKVLEEE